jgi:hypothetical protein
MATRVLTQSELAALEALARTLACKGLAQSATRCWA